jgi:GNAT superfamily N-acetyltransferase
MTGTRPAREDDLPALREIERAAGRSFAELGMDLVADDEPPTIELLRRYVAAGRAWVHADDRDRPVAYLLADLEDGCAHVEQVSVHPDSAGAGLGRELVEHLMAWARERRLPAVTLTTFVDVPWNGPYYRRLGFRDLAESELTPELKRIRSEEAARGLDAWPRTALRYELTPPAPSG